jgi:predicted RND superfamily exporter protein
MRGNQLPGLDRGPGGAAPAAGGWRAPALALAAVLTALSLFGISRLRLDDDLRSLLRDSDAEFALIDELADRFGAPDRDCIVRATAPTGDLFAARPLDELRRLCDELARVKGVAQVRSIFDVRRQGTAGALLPVIPHSSEPLDAEQLAAARGRALEHPLTAGHLLTPDAASSLILVRLTAEANASASLGPALAGIERALADARQSATPLTLELTGLPALRHQATQALRRDMLVFNSLGLSLAVVLSALAARSLRSTVVASVPPFVGAVWAMGILGLCGAPVNILTSVVPSLALVVGTCDSIHFIEDMRRSRRRGIDALSASASAMQRIGAACGLTSLVTAIGFASLAFARIETVRLFGIAAAAGAVASFLAVTLLTPLIASSAFCRGMHIGRSWRPAGRLASLLTAFSVRHARPIAIAGVAATAALALVSLGLDADNRVADALPRGAPASRALMGVDRDFGGTSGIDIVVRWPEGTDWRDPAVLDALEAVHGVLARDGGLTRPISLATVASALPDRARSRLDADHFPEMLDPDARMAIVRTRVADAGSRALEKVYDRIDAGLAAIAAARPGWSFELSGISVVSARNIRQLVRDLGSSLTLEIAVIGTILALAFRSPLAGIVSLIPNIFPLAVIAAIVVLSGRSLDPATVIVFNVCLGLAVDDTVHVLSAVSRQRREGVSITTAVRRAVAETGNPIMIGGLVLTVGFAVVVASSVPSLAGFGRLACAAVAAATIAELILLPALLVVTESFVTRWRARRDQAAWRDGIFGTAPLAWPALDRTGEPARHVA